MRVRDSRIPGRMAGLCVLLLAGCGAGNGEIAEEAAQPQSVMPAFSLEIAGSEELQALLEKHRGRVVLVDFWATWCLPCLEQFPHTVEMAHELRESGLAVIGVSMDSPSAEPQVRTFLENQDAEFANLLSKYQSATEATKEFGLPGPVPCYRVYDREGELRREFSVDPRAERQFTAEDVKAAVMELL